MIITNWQTIISEKRTRDGSGVYIIYDGCGTCLYVGESSEVNYRLLSHWGIVNSFGGQSRAGGYVRSNSPTSLQWPIVILQPQDYEDRDFKEVELIRSLMPLYNSTNKTGVPRPSEMQMDVRLAESSSLFLNI